MLSVTSGNGYASRIMPACGNSNVDNFSDRTSADKFTYHAKLTIEGDVFTLTYDGQQVFSLNLRDEFATKKADYLSSYPSGSFIMNSWQAAAFAAAMISASVASGLPSRIFSAMVSRNRYTS